MSESRRRPAATFSVLRGSLRAVVVLLLAWYAVQWRGSPGTMAHAFVPGAGGEALPPRVLAIQSLLARHPGEFRLAPALQDAQTWQRTVEYLYPVRVGESGPRVVSAANDRNMAGCRLVERAGELALYDCAGRG